MALENGIISMTTQGRAMSDGADGEVIPVMNVSSKQVIDARVTGPQNVRVHPPVDILSMK
jgi:flagella basal body P-ring formation protein FlgA